MTACRKSNPAAYPRNGMKECFFAKPGSLPSRKKHSPGGRETFAGLFPPLGIFDLFARIASFATKGIIGKVCRGLWQTLPNMKILPGAERKMVNSKVRRTPSLRYRCISSFFERFSFAAHVSPTNPLLRGLRDSVPRLLSPLIQKSFFCALRSFRILSRMKTIPHNICGIGRF